MRPIPLVTKDRIYADLKRGYTQEEVVKRLGVSLGTIKRKVQEAREDRPTPPAKPGPRSMLSSVQESVFVAMVTEMGPWMTADQLLKFWQRVTQQEMSKSTMRLHAARLGSCKPRASVVMHRITEEESDALLSWWFERLCMTYADWLPLNLTDFRHPLQRFPVTFGSE